MFFNPSFARNRMAQVGVHPRTGRMLAADQQGPILQSRYEYNTAVLFETEIVRAMGIPLHISPLCRIHLVLIEELIVATDNDLGAVGAVVRGKQTPSVCREVISLIVPVPEPP